MKLKEEGEFLKIDELKKWKNLLESGNVEEVLKYIDNILEIHKDTYLEKGTWVYNKAFNICAKTEERVLIGDGIVTVDEKSCVLTNYIISDCRLATESEILQEIEYRKEFNLKWGIKYQGDSLEI